MTNDEKLAMLKEIEGQLIEVTYLALVQVMDQLAMFTPLEQINLLRVIYPMMKHVLENMPTGESGKEILFLFRDSKPGERFDLYDEPGWPTANIRAAGDAGTGENTIEDRPDPRLVVKDAVIGEDGQIVADEAYFEQIKVYREQKLLGAPIVRELPESGTEGVEED